MKADLRGIRSVLFCPGHRLDLLEEPGADDADLLVLDLEDTVPGAEKIAALRRVRDHVESLSPTERQRVLLRPNRGDRGFDGDETAIGAALAGIVVPKVESPSDLELAAEAFAGGHESNGVSYVATLETIRGVFNAAEILTTADPPAAVIFGPSDLTLELGVRGLPDHSELTYPRSHVALCAALGSVIAIDGGFSVADDHEGLARDAEIAKRLGYRAKLTTIPRHVPIINSVMGPRDDDLAWADVVLRDGSADAVSLAKARLVVERSEAIQRWTSTR